MHLKHLKKKSLGASAFCLYIYFSHSVPANCLRLPHFYSPFSPPFPCSWHLLSSFCLPLFPLYTCTLSITSLSPPAHFTLSFFYLPAHWFLLSLHCPFSFPPFIILLYPSPSTCASFYLPSSPSPIQIPLSYDSTCLHLSL